VLLNSSELDEVLALADDAAPVHDDDPVGGAEATRESVGMLMAGART
jgi:ABC-type uncharacterized transport system ATPase subunit